MTSALSSTYICIVIKCSDKQWGQGRYVPCFAGRRAILKLFCWLVTILDFDGAFQCFSFDVPSCKT